MTFSRSICTAPAVALFGLVQLGVATDAHASSYDARSTVARTAIAHMASFCGLPEFGAFSAWSAPVNIGTTVNTQYEESAPAISPDGRSLYFNRNTNGADPTDPGRLDEDLYVSYRNNRNRAWGVPTPLASINTREFNERNAALSRDGSMLFFSSNRTPSVGLLDLYVSRRTSKNKHTPDAWSAPVNLGAVVNSVGDDIGPGYFANPRGNDVLYFTSARPGGPGLLDIQASTRGADGAFGAPVLVAELSSPSNDARPAIRADGLEVVLQSNRLPSAGLADVWVATRETLTQPWGAPVNVGPVVNTDLQDRQVALSDDAETLYFASNRPGVGLDDIWTSTREEIGH